MADDINWREFDFIKEELQAHAERRENPDNDSMGVGHWFLEPVGSEFLLRVRITDPELAQITLMRAFGKHSAVAGMEIGEIIIDPEGYQRNKIVENLREMADRIEQEGLES